jgi:hypothetical protein
MVRYPYHLRPTGEFIKARYDELLTIFALNVKLRPYIAAGALAPIVLRAAGLQHPSDRHPSASARYSVPGLRAIVSALLPVPLLHRRWGPTLLPFSTGA